MIAFRHAPPLEAGICYGRLDVPVSETPERAAAAVMNAINTRPRRIWTSPAVRCAQLAEILAAETGAKLIEDARLQELDFGRWEGQRWRAIAERDGAAYERWAGDWTRKAPPAGETVGSLERRVAGWIRESAPEVDEVVVTHAGVIRALRVLVECQSWPKAMAAPVLHIKRYDFGVGESSSR